MPGYQRCAGLSALERFIDDMAGLFLDSGQVVGVTQGLGVDLVLVLGTRGAGCEPSILGDDLNATNCCAIARGLREDGLDLLASDALSADVVRGESFETGLLLAVGVSVDTRVVRLAEAVL